MNYEEFVKLMISPGKRYLMDMGAGSLTRILGLTISKPEIKAAKREARNILNGVSRGDKLPKILILDIETAPIKAYVWRLWKQDVGLHQVDTDWFMLTWSAKWLGSDTVISEKLTSEEAVAEDDSRILKVLWNLLDKADIAIAHNGISFDIPKIKARFFLNDMPPTSPYRQIDTKLVAQKQFGFTSNKLDALAKYIGIPGKIETNLQLWIDCINGVESALSSMETYNIQDVLILEKVYLKLRPWISGHPNVALYSNEVEPLCTVCGGNDLEEVNKFHYTNVGKYPVYKCKCGAYLSSRKSIIPKEKRDLLLMSR